MSDATLPRKLGRGIWRGVYSSLFDHPDFQRLTANERLTLLACRLGPLNTPASIFRYYPEVLQAQCGLDARELEAAFQGLEKKPTAAEPWIVRDAGAGVLWVRNGLRYDPNLTPDHHSGHRAAVLRAVAALPSCPIVKRFRRYYKLSGATGLPAQEPPASLPRREAQREGGSGKERTSTPTPKGKETTSPDRLLSQSGSNGRSGDFQAVLARINEAHPELAVDAAETKALEEVQERARDQR